MSRDRTMWLIIAVMFIVAVSIPSPDRTPLGDNVIKTQQVR